MVNSKKKKAKKTKWSVHEDKLLISFVNKSIRDNNAIIWNRINISKRNSKQCKERYENHLRSNINRNPFSNDEINVIIQKQLEHGNKWTLISKYIPNRSPMQIKNIWHMKIKKYIKKSPVNNISSEYSDIESEENTFSNQVFKNNKHLIDHEIDLHSFYDFFPLY